MLNKIDLINTYYSLGYTAVHEIDEHFKKEKIGSEKLLVSNKMVYDLGENSEKFPEFSVSIPHYRYRYKNLDGSYVKNRDIQYQELRDAVKQGVVIREAVFTRFDRLKLYLIDYEMGQHLISDLDLNKVYAKLRGVNSVFSLCCRLTLDYHFTCANELEKFLNKDSAALASISTEKEEELVYLVGLLSKIAERPAFIDVQDEFVEDRALRQLCDINAFSVNRQYSSIATKHGERRN